MLAVKQLFLLIIRSLLNILNAMLFNMAIGMHLVFPNMFVAPRRTTNYGKDLFCMLSFVFKLLFIIV